MWYEKKEKYNIALYYKKRDLQSELEIELRFQARASQIRSKSQYIYIYIEEGEKLLYTF